jgi:hypothetical protein
MSSNGTHEGADICTEKHIHQENERGSSITPASSVDGNESDVVKDTQGNITTSRHPDKRAACYSDSLARHHTDVRRTSPFTSVREELSRSPYQGPSGMSQEPSPNHSSTQQLDVGHDPSPLARATKEDIESEHSGVLGQQRTPISQFHRTLTDSTLENNYRVLPLLIGCIIPVSVKDISYGTRNAQECHALLLIDA